MNAKSARKAFLYALLAVLFWSTSPTAFKLGLRYMDTWQLLTGASLSSTLVLGLLVVIRGKFRTIFSFSVKDFAFSLLMGLLNPLAYYLILFKAYSILPAQVAQPLNMIWPIVLVLLSIPILGQRISWLSMGAMLLSFSGVVLISLDGRQCVTGSSKPAGYYPGSLHFRDMGNLFSLQYPGQTGSCDPPVPQFYLCLWISPLCRDLQSSAIPRLFGRMVGCYLCGSFRNGHYLCSVANGNSYGAQERPDQQPGVYGTLSEPALCQPDTGRKNLSEHRDWNHFAGCRYCDPESIKGKNAKNSERIILGIDPGTTLMGYGVISGSGKTPAYMDMGVVDLKQ